MHTNVHSYNFHTKIYCILGARQSISNLTVYQDLAHQVPNLRYMFFSFISYSSSFPIKMLASDANMLKIKPGPIFFLTDESVCIYIYITYNR